MPEEIKLIVLPGVSMRIFWCTDDATGDNQIKLVVDDQGYYQLEKQAQQHGKTIHQLVCPGVLDALRAQGVDIAPDCIFLDAPAADLPAQTYH